MNRNSDLFCSVVILAAQHLRPGYRSPGLNHTLPCCNPPVLWPFPPYTSTLRRAPHSQQSRYSFRIQSLLLCPPIPSHGLHHALSIWSHSCQILGQLSRLTVTVTKMWALMRCVGFLGFSFSHLTSLVCQSYPILIPFSTWQAVHPLKPTQVSPVYQAFRNELVTPRGDSQGTVFSVLSWWAIEGWKQGLERWHGG